MTCIFTYSYNGDSTIKASYKSLPFGIKNVQFKTNVRIELNPQMSKSPLVGALHISCLQSPVNVLAN